MNRLRGYQQEALQFSLAKAYSLLALDVGLGKSLIAIEAAKSMKAEKILVLCPASLTANWIAEFAKWWPEVEPLRVTSKLHIFPNIGVASYDYAKTAKARFCREYDLVILDECHGYKDRTSNRSKAVIGAKGICAKAKRVIGLSATPFEKSIADLWPMIKAFGVTKLPYYQFRDRYCDVVKTKFGENIVGTKKEALPEIKEMLKDFMLVKTKEEAAPDLPEFNFYPVVVDGGKASLSELPNLHAKIKKATDIMRYLTGRGIDLEKMTYEDLLKFGAVFVEINNFNAVLKVEATLKLAKARLEESEKNKVVIMSSFKAPITAIYNSLVADYSGYIIDGGTFKDTLWQVVDDFQTNPDVRFLVCNSASAGVGLTLTAADYQIFNDIPVSATQLKQALGRCHRIGQKSDVTAISVQLDNNRADKRIFDLVKEKMDDADNLLK